MAKGSSSGRPTGFELGSCFLLSSINVPLGQKADKRRITVLELNKASDTTKSLPEAFDEAFGARLLARSVKLIEVLRANIKVFNHAIVEVLGNYETGQQYAPLLAGAKLLESDDPISAEDAKANVKEYDFADFMCDEPTDRDEEQCLASIWRVVTKMPVTRWSPWSISSTDDCEPTSTPKGEVQEERTLGELRLVVTRPSQ